MTNEFFHFIYFKSFAFLSDSMATNLTDMRCVILTFLIQFDTSKFYVEYDMRLDVFVFMRCASESQWNRLTQRYMMLFVFFFLVWNFRQTYIHFSSKRIVFGIRETFFPSDPFNRSIYTFGFIHLSERKKFLSFDGTVTQVISHEKKSFIFWVCHLIENWVLSLEIELKDKSPFV